MGRGDRSRNKNRSFAVLEWLKKDIEITQTVGKQCHCFLYGSQQFWHEDDHSGETGSAGSYPKPCTRKTVCHLHFPVTAVQCTLMTQWQPGLHSFSKTPFSCRRCGFISWTAPSRDIVQPFIGSCIHYFGIILILLALLLYFTVRRLRPQCPQTSLPGSGGTAAKESEWQLALLTINYEWRYTVYIFVFSFSPVRTLRYVNMYCIFCMHSWISTFQVINLYQMTAEMWEERITACYAKHRGRMR